MPAALGQTVACRTLYNETKQVPVEKLIIRPSVYGLILHEGQILLGQETHTEKYVLPGGGINRGETVQAALHREIMEETGITVQIGQFLHFKEDFFYYDPLDRAFQGYLFFYQCHPLHTEIPEFEYLADEKLINTLWVNAAALAPESFLSNGPTILQLIRQVI